MHVGSPNSISPWPARWAIVLACATFPLIWVGGLVTTYDAGMAVPDWPTTYGHNMFAYPVLDWLRGPWDMFIEHGHRLLGSLVGMIAIGLNVSVFRNERRGWLRVLAVVALLAVISQGVLGGMRVRFDNRQLAMIHGCFGPAFFAFAVAYACFLSPDWSKVSAGRLDRSGQRILRLSAVLVVLTYLQLILGASMRHLTSQISPDFFRILVIFHLINALAIAAHIAVLRVRIAANFPRVLGLLLPVRGVLYLVSVQLALGVGTWVVKYGWPEWVSNWDFAAGYLIAAKSHSQSMTVTAHVAIGSLILAASVLLLAQTARRFLPTGASPSRPYSADRRDGANRPSGLAMEAVR
ncbi:MAG: cytochrome oxidase assembly protein [Planctomycetes bacterium]|nr:cytochrome oxidase assembly protein [Planctomycetota bacterium]